ncbi:hypothetical protein D7X30_18745 [Corallococcus sp. AB011P]|uniref:hypothetical protein n=1 Tax=Corallococcus sp. AB011P TaxID=2316735 RepID=UPI000EA02114|nr:hypothetical protein [Corallococcus sp. AB011P]RKG57546.1 hypothetical protein D7X30_18745 [Corallococcus sp. AB011P]
MPPVPPWSWFSVLFLGALCACGTPVPAPVPPEDTPPLSEQMDPALAARLQVAREAVLADTCFRERPDGDGCEWGEFPFDPGAFAMSHDSGEAILVIDDFPTLPLRTLRYQNRLRGYFRVDGQGRLAPASFSWRVPVTLYRVLQSFATPDCLPAEQLRSLESLLSETYPDQANDSAGHGSFVFSVLVETNPHQSLVLLDTLRFQTFAAEEFCDASGTPASFERLRAKASVVADGLLGLMAEHGVRYVNLSSGVTLASVREDWMASCQGPLPGDDVLRGKLEAYTPIYAALFNTPGVFTAQSAIDAVSPVENPFDFPSEAFPNRLRVGFITVLESGLDAEGRGAHASLGGWPARANVDLYVNTGVLPQRPFEHNRTPLLQADAFGVDILPITRATTSWVTPLALSRFIHARSAHFAGQELSDALIRQVMERMRPPRCADLPGGVCIYQDPLLHGQTEAVRLNYRRREYTAP